MVTDYDCWHPGHDDVTVDLVIRVLLDNADKRRAIWCGPWFRCSAITRARCHAGCQNALDHALITAPEARDPAVLQRLDAVAGRVLRRG
ncbi:MAG: hypothetical protein WDN69_18535 [Aliidongia sp.]